MGNANYLEIKRFSEVDLLDPFFESLREDYPSFDIWYKRKAEQGEMAYVMYINNRLSGFMYLKEEIETVDLVGKQLEKVRRLKVGTFKINSHGTILGERFLSIALRKMIEEGYDRSYVTVFKKHQGIVDLFGKFGFEEGGTTLSGELFLGKRAKKRFNDLYKDYPRLMVSDQGHSLAIQPEFHTKLFPDSKLKTENAHVIEDLALTNTITKTYLTKMKGVESFCPGDTLFIYRMGDLEPKKYHSAITSVCAVVSVTNIEDFRSYEEYVDHIGKGTVFSDLELKRFWNSKDYPIILKMVYLFPMAKKVTLAVMLV